MAFFFHSAFAGEKQGKDGLIKRIEILEKELLKLKQESYARKKLALTEKEKTGVKRAEEILNAGAKRYRLLKKQNMEFALGLVYDYLAVDKLKTESGYLVGVEHLKKHTLTGTTGLTYGLKNNVNVNARIPFVYKYEKVDSREETDLGDISLGVEYQPFREKGSWPSVVCSGSFSMPTGRSPFEINPEKELSTGNGYYSFRTGLNLSKVIDPIVAFGGLSYTYKFDETGINNRLTSSAVLKEVSPGDTVGYSIGLGYAISYNVSFSMQFQQSYSFRTNYKYDTKSVSGSTSNTAMMIFGTGFRITPKQLLYLSIGAGLTGDSSDFIVSFRLPVEFSLK